MKTIVAFTALVLAPNRDNLAVDFQLTLLVLPGMRERMTLNTG